MIRKISVLLTLAILPSLLVINAYADADTLPPLILKSPENYEVTTDRLPHSYSVSTSNFVVVDDSGKSAIIECGTEPSQKKRVQSSASYARWSFGAGEYTMTCDISDQTGNISNVSWQISILQDDLAPSWVKTVGGLYCNNTINESLYLKVVKYLNDADVMLFDIKGSGYGEIPSSFKSDTCNWKKGTLSNGEYKIILEDMASNGVFQNVSY